MSDERRKKLAAPIKRRKLGERSRPRQWHTLINPGDTFFVAIPDSRRFRAIQAGLCRSGKLKGMIVSTKQAMRDGEFGVVVTKVWDCQATPTRGRA